MHDENGSATESNSMSNTGNWLVDRPPLTLAPLPAAVDRWALFLDVDGCLVEFQSLPELVKIPAGARDSIHQLQRLLDGAVAIISGRTLADLDRLFAPLCLPSAGQYGMNRRSADGVMHQILLPEPATIEFVRAQTLVLAKQHPALHVEDKGYSIALHYRKAPYLAGDVAKAAASIVAPLEGAYEVQQGAMVQEIKPSTCNKGAAVRSFLREAPFQSRLPVFVGDDFADESAFAAVNKLGGVSIAVGADRQTEAKYVLSGPADVRRWLDEVVAALSANTGP
jgi:trehalose 6-phosphate phosphatase